MISDEIPFTNPNREAFERLTEEQKTNPASYPQGDPTSDRSVRIGEMTEPVEALYNDLRFGSSSKCSPQPAPTDRWKLQPEN